MFESMLKWLACLHPKDWINIISIVASITAIFISNYLGRLDSQKKLKHQQKVDRYNKLYVPVISFLFQQDMHNMLLFNIVGGNRFDEFSKIFQQNIKYLGKKSSDKYYRLIIKDGPLTRKYLDGLINEVSKGNLKEGDPIPMDLNVYAANSQFIDFLKEFLQESVDLAKELNLEPIGQTLLDAFPDEDNHSKLRTSEAQ